MRGKQLSWLILLCCLARVGSGYTCGQVVNNGWVNSYGWGNCYQASDGNVIGTSHGSLTDCFWWGCASWNYDYNGDISFMYSGSTYWRQWNCYYHSSSTCCNNCGNCGNCGGSWSCYRYWCAWDAWDNYYCYYDFNYNYYCDDSLTTYVYTPCHPYCNSCTVSWRYDYCQSCRHDTSRAYLWLNWPDTGYQICYTYCPRRTDNAYKGMYIAATGDLTCSWCSALCSWCADLNAGGYCYTCITSAYLIDNYAECTATFPYDSYCYTNKQCVSDSTGGGCPIELYF